MYRWLFVFLLTLILIGSAGATTVTGTVVDANGNAYANGTVSAVLVYPSGSNPSVNPSLGPFPMTSIGTFSINVTANASITPINTQWIFTFCANSVFISPAGPPQVQVCFNTPPLTISGPSQNITGSLGTVTLIGPVFSSGAGGCAPSCVNSLNNLTGLVGLTAGVNMSITPIGQNLQLSASNCVSGATNSLQKNNGAGGCAASGVSDNGTKISLIEPIDPVNAENVGQKGSPIEVYVDSWNGATNTDCMSRGGGACLYFNKALESIWSYEPSGPGFVHHTATINLAAANDSLISLDSSSTTPSGNYALFLIGSGDPGYAANCNDNITPTCTIGGRIWHKIPPTGLDINCFNGGGGDVASIPALTKNACNLNFAIVTSGIGSGLHIDGVAIASTTSFSAMTFGYSSNGIFGDAGTTFDAPVVTNSILYLNGNTPPFYPPLAAANILESQFRNDVFKNNAVGQPGYQICNVTSAVRTSTVTTLTCSAAHNFPSNFLGAPLLLPIVNMTDPSFNAMTTITVVDSTHLSYSNNGPNATSSGGIVYGPGSWNVYMVGNPLNLNDQGFNSFSHIGMFAGGIVTASQNGLPPGDSPIKTDNIISEALPSGMPSVADLALNYSGGLDSLGGNTDADQVLGAGGMTLYGSGLGAGQTQAVNDSNSNDHLIPNHSHFHSYSTQAIPNQMPEILDAVGFLNEDVRAAWPGLARSGAPIQVLYVNQCNTNPSSWTGTAVTLVPSYLDLTNSETNAGQVAAQVTLCSVSVTLNKGDRIIVGAAYNPHTALGFVAGNIVLTLQATGTNAYLSEGDPKTATDTQAYTFVSTAGQGDWETNQRMLIADTGSAASASYTLTLLGQADASHTMQFFLPKIEVIPATDALTNDEVAIRARYEPLFSSICAVGLCNPKTGSGSFGGGGGTPAGCTNAVQYNNAGSFGGTACPTVNGNYLLNENVTAGVSVAPTISLPGIPVDATNPATLLYSDRASYLNWTSGTALALPAITSNFASNFPFVLRNTAATLTITPNAGASNLIDGLSSQSVLTNFATFIYQDQTPNWLTVRFPTFQAFGSTCANPLSWSTTTGFSCLSGTSGGIPCFTAANTWSSSSALTVNVYVKGGGAGACPTLGLTTDDGTSSTYTGTGGTKSPVFTATGTTAGFMDYPQGTTSAAVAPCNTATSICEQAPTSVTSYVIDKPGAAPVNNNSAATCSNASPSICNFAKMPQTTITSGSAYTNATTGFTSVVGGAGQTLSFSVEASTNYLMTCNILWSASGATAGPKFQFTGPASPTAVQYSVMQAVTATTDGTAGATAFSTSLNASGATVVTSTNEPAKLALGLVNGVNAGTVTLQAAAQGSGTLTIQPGSWCQLQ